MRVKPGRESGTGSGAVVSIVGKVVNLVRTGRSKAVVANQLRDGESCLEGVPSPVGFDKWVVGSWTFYSRRQSLPASLLWLLNHSSWLFFFNLIWIWNLDSEFLFVFVALAVVSPAVVLLVSLYIYLPAPCYVRFIKHCVGANERLLQVQVP